MLSAGFEPAIPAIDGPQTYASDRTATVIISDYKRDKFAVIIVEFEMLGGSVLL